MSSSKRHDSDNFAEKLTRSATRIATIKARHATTGKEKEAARISATVPEREREVEYEEEELNRGHNEEYYRHNMGERHTDGERHTRDIRDIRHERDERDECDERDERDERDRKRDDEIKTLSEKLDALMKLNSMPSAAQPSVAPPRSPAERSKTPSPTNSNTTSATLQVNDITKELMKDIPRYDGSGGASKLFDYIEHFEDFASIAELSSNMEIIIATSKLNGDAKMWWRDHRQSIPIDHPNRIRNWDQLRKALIENYTPPEYAYSIRNKLRSIKQRGTVAEYNAAFTRIKLQLTDLSQSEAIHEYLRGLQPRIRDLARTQKENLADLRTLQLASLRLDTPSERTPRDEEAHSAGNAQQGRGGNNNSRGTGTRSRGSIRGNNSHKKNTSDRTNYQRRKYPCNLCDSTEHPTYECPDIPDMRDAYKSKIKCNTPQANFAISAIIDSGATQHMFNQLDAFGSTISQESAITCANSQQLKSTHIGTVNIDGISTLHDVLHVPELKHNLLSVRALTKDGNDVIFKRDGDVELINDVESHVIGHAVGDLYQLLADRDALIAETTKPKIDDYTLWHHRLGHPGRKILQTLPKYVIGLENVRITSNNDVCASCAQAKSHRLPFGSATNRSIEPLGRIHTDLCGPMPSQSISGARYILTFIDDATRYATVYFIKNKSDTFDQFINHKLLIETQSGKKLKILRSDGGGEYINAEMHEYLAENGIRHETTTAETPQQNGVAERYNRTLLETIRALKISAGIPDKLWAELAATAAYLRNRLPTRANSKLGKGNISPYEAYFDHKPVIDHLRVIWADAYAHIPKSKRHKLAPRSNKLKLIGYHDQKKAYRLWNPDRDQIEISRDVIFDESIVLNASTTINIADDDAEFIIDSIIGERVINDENQFLVKWLGYSDDDNTWEPIGHVADTEAFQIWNNRNQVLIAAETIDHTNVDPITYDDAISSSEAHQWRDAIKSELNSINDNNTWTIVPAPRDRRPIGCKWIFKRKLNTDGSISRYKARLVAKGYAQIYGVDYDETYAPVAKFTSIRAILSIGASLDLEIHQMDVKTAFLNGDLIEDIYMDVPEGIDNVDPGSVCKLNRTLYGLKQSPRMWNKKIDDYLINQGFTRLDTDHSIYIRRHQQSLNIIAIYVDDLILLTDTIETMRKLKLELHNAFKMTDCGEIHHFLGLRVDRDRANRKLTLDQEHFVDQILNRFKMSDCNPVSTPLDPSVKLQRSAEAEADKSADETLFRQIIGSLMYLMIATRPDIAAAVSIISQFSTNPTQAHYQAAKRILRYLKETSKFKLHLGDADASINRTDWL